MGAAHTQATLEPYAANGRGAHLRGWAAGSMVLERARRGLPGLQLVLAQIGSSYFFFISDFHSFFSI
jgi:hypothetical protein